jgi:hypothetical protein
VSGLPEDRRAIVALTTSDDERRASTARDPRAGVRITVLALGHVAAGWTGYVFAIALEKCRSLVPGILCHACWNALIFAWTVAVFR